jgi:hypothetical protein
MKIGFPYPLARNFPHLLLLILALSTLRAEAIERWEVLPPTPKPIRSEHSGQANANGISIYYAVYEQGSPGASQPNWTDAQLKAITACQPFRLFTGP